MYLTPAPSPQQRRSGGGRRNRRGVDANGDRTGPELSAVLDQLNIRSPACQALVVCETHRLIASLPEPLLLQYRRVRWAQQRHRCVGSSATVCVLTGDACTIRPAGSLCVVSSATPCVLKGDAYIAATINA